MRIGAPVQGGRRVNKRFLFTNVRYQQPNYQFLNAKVTRMIRIHGKVDFKDRKS